MHPVNCVMDLSAKARIVGTSLNMSIFISLFLFFLWQVAISYEKLQAKEFLCCHLSTNYMPKFVPKYHVEIVLRKCPAVLSPVQMTGTATQMYNDRNILYPSITICPGRPAFSPNYVMSSGDCPRMSCPGCPTGCDFGHFGRKVNLSNIIAVLAYYKVNETG